MSLAIKIHSPVFVHRIWECAGTDLLGVFESDHLAGVFADALVNSGREPERTMIVSCNAYDGVMVRHYPKPASKEEG